MRSLSSWILLLTGSFPAIDHSVVGFTSFHPRTRAHEHVFQFNFKLLSSPQGYAPYVDDPILIRNIALVGHSHSGKTTLAEWMLYDENIIPQQPKLGSSILDSDPTEISRHSSLFSHFMRIPHRKSLIELSDTPYGDFPSDAIAALDGADSALIAVSATDGVQSGTINAFQHCSKNGIKKLMVLTKMDRPFINIADVLSSIEISLGTKPVPLQVCIGEGDSFLGVKSLLILDDDGQISRNNDPQTAKEWKFLEEAVAMTNDDLLVDYLDSGGLEDEKVVQGLREAVISNKLLPLVYTSAINNVGVNELMDTIIAALPNPLEVREDALKAACEASSDRCGIEPGIESGFAGRVLHTIVDSFGSLSVVRIISNKRNFDTGLFESLPQTTVNILTKSQIKMPSMSTCFALCGKSRHPLVEGAQLLPGDVIALPKVGLETNDIICDLSSVEYEEAEIHVEVIGQVLSPLSRPVVEVPLMAAATISLNDTKGARGGKRKSGANDDKLINALSAISRQDLSIKVEQNSGKWVVRCMSRDHLNLLVERLRNRYDVEVELGDPPIAYRETISRAVKQIEGRHKKQSGGSGQFGVCVINIEPLAEGSGVQFESNIKGGAISKPFITSVEKGVREQLSSGGPLGFPVTDVKVTLVDGKMHSVDSKDIAFQSAGRIAVKEALKKAGTIFLQPMEKVTFLIDEGLQGEINGIISRVDGYVTLSNIDKNHLAEVEAIIPSRSIAEVSETLRAESAGEGQYSSIFSHYQSVSDVQVKAIFEKMQP